MENYAVLKTPNFSPVRPITSTLPYELWGFLVWQSGNRHCLLCTMAWNPSDGPQPWGVSSHTWAEQYSVEYWRWLDPLQTSGLCFLCVLLSSLITVFCECSPSCSPWTLSSIFSNKLVHWALPWFPLCALWPANSRKTLSWIILGLISLLLISQGSFAFMSSVLKTLFHTHAHTNTLVFLSFWTVSGRRVNQARYSILAIRSRLHHPFLCMLFLKDKTGLFVLHSKFG